MTIPLVTLTFDNGPSQASPSRCSTFSPSTGARNVLRDRRNLATTEGRALGRRTVAEGHQLGGHTWSHAIQFGVAGDTVLSDELVRTRVPVDEAGGDRLLFRPYGASGVIDDRLMSAFAATSLCSGGYTCMLWNVLPHDWDDQAGWVEQALTEIGRQPWSVVVLHDVVDAALPRLDEFLTTVSNSNPTWSQDFSDECTPIRGGSPTSSFDTLCASN